MNMYRAMSDCPLLVPVRRRKSRLPPGLNLAEERTVPIHGAAGTCSYPAGYQRAEQPKVCMTCLHSTGGGAAGPAQTAPSAECRRFRASRRRQQGGRWRQKVARWVQAPLAAVIDPEQSRTEHRCRCSRARMAEWGWCEGGMPSARSASGQRRRGAAMIMMPPPPPADPEPAASRRCSSTTMISASAAIRWMVR